MMAMEFKVAHKHILRHMLGIRVEGDVSFRNRFVAGEGHADMPTLNELLVNDFVTVQDNPGGSGYLFKATEKGYAAVNACLPTAKELCINGYASAPGPAGGGDAAQPSNPQAAGKP
jgi:hypothetical protein